VLHSIFVSYCTCVSDQDILLPGSYTRAASANFLALIASSAFRHVSGSTDQQ